MSKAISLHIGLNYVDPNAYGGWDGELAGCINDANSMQGIANSQGFTSSVILDAQATAETVINKISQAANELQSGDTYLLTYSGHGGQIPDETGEETDGLNETWVLWNRELLDNELYNLWSKFNDGVRIIVSSDSCHSGTVVRNFMHTMSTEETKKAKPELNETEFARYESRKFKKRAVQYNNNKKRTIPVNIGLRNYNEKKDMYNAIRQMAGSKSDNTIGASLIFISGCQDSQFSYDGPVNGAFTTELLSTWNSGNFSGNYMNFYNQITGNMPDYQKPNFVKLGRTNSIFEQEKPYTILSASGSGSANSGGTATGNTTGNSGSSSAPSVQLPSSWSIDEAPTFSINKGANPYYYIELATDASLFDYTANNSRRNSTNFYATWADSLRLTNPTYTIPANVWNSLKNASRIFVRIGTTTSGDGGWDNLQMSFADHEYSSAPSFTISLGSTGGGSPSGSTTLDASLSISASVGRRGENENDDVRTIQTLVNSIPSHLSGSSELMEVDGEYGNATLNAIKKFQQTQDLDDSGLVEPNSNTLLLMKLKAGLISIH